MGTWYRRQVHGIGLEPWPELHPLRRLLAGIPSSYVLDCGVRAQAGVSLAGGRGVPASVLFLRCRCCFAHAGSNSRGIRTQPGWCRICARYSALVRPAGTNGRGCSARLCCCLLGAFLASAARQPRRAYVNFGRCIKVAS